MTTAQLAASTISSTDDAVLIALPGLTDTVEDFGPAKIWPHIATDGKGSYVASSWGGTHASPVAPVLAFSGDDGATWSVETDGVDDGGGTTFVWIAGVCWDPSRGRFWALADCGGSFFESRLYWTTDGTWHPATNGNSFTAFGPSGVLFPDSKPRGLVALGSQLFTGGNPGGSADITALQQCDDPFDGVFNTFGISCNAISESPVHGGIQLPSWLAVAGSTAIALFDASQPRRLNGGAVTVAARSGSAGSLYAVAGDGAGNWVAIGSTVYAVSTDDGLNWTGAATGLGTVDTNWVAYGAHFDGTSFWFTAARHTGGTGGMLLEYDLGTDTWTEHTVTALAAGGYALTGWPPTPKPLIDAVDLTLAPGHVLTHGKIPLILELGDVSKLDVIRGEFDTVARPVATVGEWDRIPTPIIVPGPTNQGPAVFGPMFRVLDDNGDPIPEPPLTVEVITREDPTPGWTIPLDLSFDRQFTDVLNEPGDAAVSLGNEDPHLADIDPDVDLFRFRYYGWATIAMRPDRIQRTSITKAGGAGRVTKFSGPGHLSLLDEALVYPSRGTNVEPVEEDRVFNWASPYLDDSGWGDGHDIVEQDQASPYWSGLPGGWPAPGAIWMGSRDATGEWAQQGWTYNRCTFSSPGGRAIIYFTADAGGEVWLDGQLVVSSAYDLGDPTQIRTVVVDLPAGDHLMGVSCINDPDPEGDMIHNPGGFLLAVLPIDPFGTVADWGSNLLLSGMYYPWKMVDNTVPNGFGGTTDPPGVTPGLVIRALFEEAQARGDLTNVHLVCEDDVDAEGNPWPVVGELTTKVGTDLLTFLRELSATYIDMWMSPAQLELWVWGIDQRGSTRPTELHPPTDPTDPFSGDLPELVYSSTPVKANAILIRYTGGWYEATNPTSIAAVGRREVLLSIVASSRFTAVQIAEKQLAIYGNPRTEIAAGLEPIASETERDLPYWNFGVGDTITVPDANGDPVAERVMEIGVTTDPEGKPIVAPKLKDLLLQSAERWEQATKKMTDGTVRGDSKVATPIGNIRSTPPNCCVENGGGGPGG